MPEGSIRGKFEYNDKVYPFFFVNRIITVPQVPFEYNKDFLDTFHFDYLKGVTDNNKYIFFLDCDVAGGAFAQIASSLQFVCKGYVLSDCPEGNYDQVEFSSPALNGFYSPHSAIQIESDEICSGARGLTFRNCEDISQNFSCEINKEHIEFTLGFRSFISLKPEDSSIVFVNTSLSMKFCTHRFVTDLAKYYLYLQDFLVFVNFKSDIPINEILLYKKNDKSKYEKCGAAKFFQHDCSQYSPDSRHSISYNDLSNECLPKLFSVIAERRFQDSYNPFFIPSDAKDARYFDSAKWLITAISFEGELSRRYPDFKYKTDEKFKAAKDLLLKTIDDAVIISGVSINHPQNAAFNSFRHLIIHADDRLEKKFQFCLNKYRDEIAPLLEKYVCLEEIDGSIDFAKAYADYRNSTAHGTILPISKVEKITFQLMRCFIYILILECGGVSNQKIKKIIMQMF